MSRAWNTGFALACAGLVVAVALAWVTEARRPWHGSEAQSGSSAPGVVELVGIAGVERCQTCHAVSDDGVDHAHATLRSSHPARVQGCVACHGGEGRALDAEHAHARAGRHRLLPAEQRAARCVLCHVPGSVDGTHDVVRGFQAMADLGCLSCHRLRDLRQAADQQGGYGPDLDDVGRLEPARLRQMLHEPKHAFGSTTDMPSFGGLLDAQPAIERALLTALASLRADLPRPRARGDAQRACAGCHASRPARGLTAHGCVWILERRDALRCERCHVHALPPGSANEGRCLYLDGQRSVCGVCHQEAPR
ncbi:MAG: hypothetical protein ABIJ09_06135 [Pseudomonadota bacterium]